MKEQEMGTIQQRFEVDQTVAAVYEAIAEPQHVLQSLPEITGVTRVSDGIYRLTLGAAGATRDIELELTAKPALHRVEWRTGDGIWSGAVNAESIGPVRTAVSVHAEASTLAETESPPASAIHDALQAFKRALESQQIKISHAASAYSAHTQSQSRDASTGTRRHASDWRSATSSPFGRPAEFPFAVMRTISHQMDRVWDQMWRGAPLVKLPRMMPGLPWNPNIEVCEQGDQVRVCVDVPGIDESRLQVEIDKGALTIRGERQDERPDERAHRRSELHYGSFTRRIPLPDGVDPDAARAILRNGVLEVRIPLHRREPRRVPVQHTGG